MNFFNKVIAVNSLSMHTKITVSGHSKGGNKAQFITIHSPLVDRCFSFNGQGFSPEAINSLKKEYGFQFDKQKKKIISISSENDYVNVLGTNISEKDKRFYIRTTNGIHTLESLFLSSGYLRAECNQGYISEYVSSVSDKLMKLPPNKRKYATIGVMNIFQKYIDNGIKKNNSKKSLEAIIKSITNALQVIFPDWL